MKINRALLILTAMSVCEKFYAQNIEFSWNLGDVSFSCDVIHRTVQIDLTALQFSWLETKTGLGLTFLPFWCVSSIESRDGHSPKPESVEKKYNPALWGRDNNLAFYRFSFLPVEIVYTPFNIDDFIYLFFYGRASWQFWQNSYANFATKPFSSFSNGFYGTIGVRIAGFIFVEETAYRASMSVFMEYTTKNELRLGISADILGSIFGMAQAVSNAFSEQYKNDNPDVAFQDKMKNPAASSGVSHTLRTCLRVVEREVDWRWSYIFCTVA